MTAFELAQQLMKVDPDQEVLFELGPEPDEYGERSSLAANWQNVGIKTEIQNGKLIISAQEL